MGKVILINQGREENPRPTVGSTINMGGGEKYGF